jgi:regulator of RNase E activity RraA
VTHDDLVLGDDDGVLFVPSRQGEEIFTLAETLRDAEWRQAEGIRAGVSLRSQVRFGDFSPRNPVLVVNLLTTASQSNERKCYG